MKQLAALLNISFDERDSLFDFLCTQVNPFGAIVINSDKKFDSE